MKIKTRLNRYKKMKTKTIKKFRKKISIRIWISMKMRTKKSQLSQHLLRQRNFRVRMKRK